MKNYEKPLKKYVTWYNILAALETNPGISKTEVLAMANFGRGYVTKQYRGAKEVVATKPGSNGSVLKQLLLDKLVTRNRNGQKYMYNITDKGRKIYTLQTEYLKTSTDVKENLFKKRHELGVSNLNKDIDALLSDITAK